MEGEKCKYCSGSWEKRLPLMKNGKGDYYVKINQVGFLEDSEIGNPEEKYSLFGVQLNNCPMCGRSLKQF